MIRLRLYMLSHVIYLTVLPPDGQGSSAAIFWVLTMTFEAHVIAILCEVIPETRSHKHNPVRDWPT